MLSRQPGINRTFQIRTYKTWPYTSLHKIFDDFSENSTFPLLVPEKEEDFTEDDADYFARQNRIRFKLSPSQTKIVILGGSYPQLTTWNDRGTFTQQFNRLKPLLSGAGLEKTFQMKSEMAPAIWRLKPRLQGTLDKLILSLRTPSGGYNVMHVRRGDKIFKKEMADIPIEIYHAKLEVTNNFLVKTGSIYDAA